MPARDYDSLAQWYDPLLSPFLDSMRHELTRLLAGLHARQVVDLCCGTGRQAVFLHEAGMEVTGVDLSGPMLEVARRKSPQSIPYIEADAAQTGLPAAGYDAALLSLALHELPDEHRLAVLAEAGRLLAPQGTLVVVDYHRPESLPGRVMLLPIRLVERMAGREHHANFREFMRGKAACGLLERAGLESSLAFTRMRDCIGAFVVKPG